MIFSLFLALGTVLGLVWVIYQSPPGLGDTYANIGILVLLAALIGARAAYIIPHWTYFQGRLIEIPQVWLGGLAWPGALAGGVLGTLIVAWVLEMPLGRLADRLQPLLVAFSVTLWLGCWQSGCAYGPESAFGLPTRDEWGLWKTRLPLQLIAAILTLASYWGIEQLRDRKTGLCPGMAASLGVSALSLTLLLASFLRADPYPVYRGLRLETWAALVSLALGVIFTIGVLIKARISEPTR